MRFSSIQVTVGRETGPRQGSQSSRRYPSRSWPSSVTTHHSVSSDFVRPAVTRRRRPSGDQTGQTTNEVGHNCVDSPPVGEMGGGWSSEPERFVDAEPAWTLRIREPSAVRREARTMAPSLGQASGLIDAVSGHDVNPAPRRRQRVPYTTPVGPRLLVTVVGGVLVSLDGFSPLRCLASRYVEIAFCLWLIGCRATRIDRQATPSGPG